MALPQGTKKEPRPVAVTVRLSKRTVNELKLLAKKNDLTQADVIEHLIHQEFEESEKRKDSKKK